MLGRYGSILAIMLLAAPGPAWAGAWLMDKGEGQIVFGGTLSRADNAFDGSRKLGSTPRYRKFELQGLFEYGLTDRFTLMLGPGYQHIDIAAPTDASRSGFGYSEFGGRYRFLQGDSWVFSGQAMIRAPGTGQGFNPAAVGYTEPEFDVRALFGKSFTAAGLPAFLDLQLAQRFRLGNSADEFRFDATFGIRPAEKWLLLVQSLNVVSEGASPNLLIPSYDYSKLQISAVYSLTPALSLQVGGFTTFSGRNALQENGLVAGIWYKF